MQKMKKTLTLISLIALAISSLMLISAVLFAMPVFSDEVLRRILFIMATFAIASGLALIELPVLNKKRLLGIVGLSLLGFSTLLALILFAVPSLLEFGFYAKLTLSLTITSIMFIIIIVLYSKIGSSRMPFQIFTYACYSVFDLLLLLLVWGINIFELTFMIYFFVILCIVNPALFVALLVLGSGKKANTDKVLPKDSSDMITISKTEYETLKHENETLKATLAILKQENQNL